MKKLICVTGIDGSGKSTLIDELNKRILNSCVANVWQSLDSSELFKSRAEILKYLSGLTPDSRVYYLSHAIKYGMQKAQESDADVILIDGYVYKYFAPELALGASEKLVHQIISTFPLPDKVICLELDPSISFKRKDHPTAYECGFSDEISELTYIRFQEKVIAQRTYFDTDNWSFIESEKGLEHAIEEAMNYI